MTHWLKLLVGVLLLPVCLSTSQTFFWVLIKSGGSESTMHAVQGIQEHANEGDIGDEAGSSRKEVIESTPRPGLTLVPLFGGAACWLIIYILLPRPIWVYVFGHEVTHVIWAWLFEARIRKFHVSSKGGHVVLDKVNFLIILAPYFFPLYALCIAGVYGLGNLLGDWTSYRAIFLLLLGAAYGFHVTLTFHAMQTEQTDITSQGWLFSVVVIWLGNLAIVVPGLCLLLGVPTAAAWHQWVADTAVLYRLLFWFV